MAEPIRLPGLTIAERGDLFAQLLEVESTDADLISIDLGGRPGWLVMSPHVAREILRSRAPKTRSFSSRSVVGGYPALTGGDFHKHRRDVVVALNLASRELETMARTLDEVSANDVAGSLPPRDYRSSLFTLWMIRHLVGESAKALERGLLSRGIEGVMSAAERAQSGFIVRESHDRILLRDALLGCVRTGKSPFLDHLRAEGWRDDEIVAELVSLAAAGWESTAAVVTSGVTVGLPALPSEQEVDELLRLFPASWLIVRELSGSEPWARSGELAVVSPWLIHRSRREWPNADQFEPERFAGSRRRPAYMPFGSGPRRCPADTYSRAQIYVAMQRFGRVAPGEAKVGLLERRSAALISLQDGFGEND